MTECQSSNFETLADGTLRCADCGRMFGKISAPRRLATPPEPPAVSQPSDEDWTPEQIDELAGVVRDKCGPATAQRLRGIIERAQAAAASQPSIERDEAMDRTYIPMPGGWEVQTQGKGSSFRLCDTKSGDRWIITDKRLHSALEQMARDANAATQPPAASQPSEPVKRWCETCEGDGYVFQEPQAGCHVGGDHPCPDCDGKGYWFASQPPAASQPTPGTASDAVLEAMREIIPYDAWIAMDYKHLRALYAATQLPAASQPSEPIAWESTTVCYTKFITEARYQKFSPKIRGWYRPYRCSNCATPPTPSDPPEDPAASQPSYEDWISMIDAAMVEMRNIHPPLRRSECERLLCAALAAVQGKK